MIRQLTDEAAGDFLTVHEPLVYGALKACHVAYSQANYEDYLQIGRLKLVEAYETYPSDLSDEERYYQFTGYAYQRVRWGILDELRKAVKARERECMLPDGEVLEQPGLGVSLSSGENSCEEAVIYWELFQSMLQCLSEQEQKYLEDAVIRRLSVKVIAEKYGVSRKTVYQWKHRIGQKLAHFRTDLKNT